jgi:manganese/zinc/iron transport system permease protein
LFRITVVVALIGILLALFWRPLAISTFDEGFVASLGLPVTVISLGLVIASALAAVAAFDAVGSIIVIAMFICPPAAARLMTNRLGAQIAWSVAFALLSSILGYVLAGYGPLWIGGTNAVSAAGMIATVSGVILAITAFAGPERRAVN